MELEVSPEVEVVEGSPPLDEVELEVLAPMSSGAPVLVEVSPLEVEEVSRPVESSAAVLPVLVEPVEMSIGGAAVVKGEGSARSPDEQAASRNREAAMVVQRFKVGPRGLRRQACRFTERRDSASGRQ